MYTELNFTPFKLELCLLQYQLPSGFELLLYTKLNFTSFKLKLCLPQFQLTLTELRLALFKLRLSLLQLLLSFKLTLLKLRKLCLLQYSSLRVSSRPADFRFP